MSTVADVLTSTAYRLGENSSPSASNEKSRRIKFIDEAHKAVFKSQYFWFTEDSTTFNSVANQEEYTTAGGFPTNFRDMIELRVDNKLYTYIPQAKVFGLYEKDNSLYSYNELNGEKHWYIFDNTLHILPKPTTSGTNNISMKYLKYPTSLTATTDTIEIPDLYIEALSAYAYARISQIKAKRGDASDGFGEFDEIVKQMIAENNRRQFYGKSVRPIHSDYLQE